MTKKETNAITATINGTMLELAFDGIGDVRLDANRLSDEIRAHAMMHGLKQKLVDAAAIGRNPDTGRSATVQEKYEAVREVFERLVVGNWNKGRAEGTGTGNGGLLFRALCRMYPGKTESDIRGYLEGLDKAQQAALRKNPRVANIIEEIKAESATDAGDDSDALLAGLED